MASLPDSPSPSQGAASSRKALVAGGALVFVLALLTFVFTGRDTSRDTQIQHRIEVVQDADETPAVRGEPVTIASGSTVKDFSEAFDVSTAEVIKMLMGMGEMATITQSLSDEAMELLAEELKRRFNGLIV